MKNITKIACSVVFCFSLVPLVFAEANRGEGREFKHSTSSVRPHDSRRETWQGDRSYRKNFGVTRVRHYYRPGAHISRIPPKHHHFVHRDRDYYYFGGSFFLHPGGHYEVVRAPYGARVPYLPPGYVTFYVGPKRYFYFNYTYYLWDDHRNDYIVVREPDGAEDAIVGAAAESFSEIYAYPAQGQSAEQQDRDYYDCHVWSVEESGFDPTLEGQNVYKSRDYRRAMIACLEGRGYSVR